jgi:hypothetical protein
MLGLWDGLRLMLADWLGLAALILGLRLIEADGLAPDVLRDILSEALGLAALGGSLRLGLGLSEMLGLKADTLGDSEILADWLGLWLGLAALMLGLCDGLAAEMLGLWLGLWLGLAPLMLGLWLGEAALILGL